MNNQKEIAKYCIDGLLKAGLDKAQSILTEKITYEFNVKNSEMDLLRTINEVTVDLFGIVNNKKGAISINKTDFGSIDNSVESLLKQANASKPDTAYDIAEKQPAQTFNVGDEEPNLDTMYDKLKTFINYTKKTYPTLNVRSSIVEFLITKTWFLNSNGVDFYSRQGTYNCSIQFLSKEGEKTSSFNGSSVSYYNLDAEMQNNASFDALCKQSTEQVNPSNLPEKFIGDMIITPDCMRNFVSNITSPLNNGAIISGNSFLKDKLNETIANPVFSLSSMPATDDITTKYFFTNDGYKAQNSKIIDKGVLKTFLLDLYGANKTGHPKAVNNGGNYVVDSGNDSFEDIIKSTKKGILLSRFSGGYPSVNGDFSGVAKNSYYIENGEIKYPLSETMVSGNLAEMLQNITQISKEQIDFGSQKFPWIKAKGITVSGK